MSARDSVRWIIVLFCLCLVGAPVSAQESTHSLYLPSVGTGPPLVPATALSPDAGTALISWEYDQLVPAMSYDVEAGKHMAVWEDRHWGNGAYRHIYSRLVTDAGAPTGNIFAVSDQGSVHRLVPDIAYGKGEQMVVWEHATTSDNHDIHGQRMSSSGVMASSEFTVTYVANSESNPAIAYNAFNQTYLVVWEHKHSATDIDIRGQRLNANGGVLGSAFNIDTGANDQLTPDVACSATDGSCLVVYAGDADAHEEFDIHGKTLSADGSTLSSRIDIETWDGDQVTPRVAWHPLRNEFFVVWADGHWDLLKKTLYGQILSTAGSKVDDVTITSVLDGWAEEPDVAYVPYAKGWLVVWENEADLGNHDIYSQLISGGGSPLTGSTPVSAESHFEGSPAVSAGAGAQAVVVWQDDRDVGTMGTDLYVTAVSLSLPTFTGHVYKGAAGETDQPLQGVGVALSCSNNAGDLGTQIDSTTTNKDGAYALKAYEVCEWYHIVETDPPEYFSVEASSPSGSGEVVDPNYIRYALPLGGKQLDNNNFWDMPVTPDDTIAPSGWANFKPTVWQDSQTVPVQVQVQDTQSGLDVPTAQYAVSTDGGSTWGSWQTATCSGSSGTTDPQIISTDAAFGQDSGASNLNKVKFQIRDRDNNLGTSPAYTVKVDTVDPTNPSKGTCMPHQPGVWSKLSPLSCSWEGAADASSGIGGYGMLWDHDPSTVPPTQISLSDDNFENYPLADHATWYLHVRAVDKAGNAASGALHLGPYKIDATPPDSAVRPDPSKVTNKSFTVEWSGSDSLSGLLNYDVQYMDLRGNQQWTKWKNGVTATSATFQGQDGHLYDFRSRARDNAGNVEPWPPSADRRVGVATYDFEALNPGLEVTQAIQDLNNSVELVEGKPTYVRFHVRSVGPSAALTAELKGVRGGTDLGTLSPSNTGGWITVQSNPQRDQRDHSFYFLLPEKWRNGTVALAAQVNPAHQLIESDYTDNSAGAVVTFLKTPPLRVVFVPITYTLNSTVRTVRTGGVNDIRAHLRKMYPIAELTSSVHATTVTYNGTMADLCDGDAYPTILASLANLQSTSNTTLGGNTIYYGTVPPDYAGTCTKGYVTGMANGIPATVAAGIVPTDPVFTGNNAAHELGHCLGRYHAECCGAGGGKSYPYPNCEISPDATKFFGFDVTDVTVYPSGDEDLMTYCWNTMWISDFTYEAIRAEIAKYPKSPAQSAAAGDVLVVTGIWNRTRGETTLSPLYRLPNLAPTVPQDGVCEVVLRQAGGQVLAQYPFVPGQDTQPMEGTDDIVVLHALVPDDPNLHRVEVHCEGKLLAAVTASGNAPTVTLLAPNGGEQWESGTQTIRWQASDADGDAVRFLLQYSTDDGASWTSLAVDVTGRSYSFDTALLAGSKNARIRVVASDGLLTGEDVSDSVFDVSGKPPQANIDGPVSGASVPSERALTLFGFAWDAEDGVIPDGKLEWRSDRAGVLGTGKELTVGPLALGEHIITLAATDSEGMQGETSITITVAVSAPPGPLHLPFIRKTGK